MGQASGVRPLDRTADKSLTTKGDIAAMERNVQEWCDKTLNTVRDETAAVVKNINELFFDEIKTVRELVDQYRQDELRYRNAVSIRGRWRRLLLWLGIGLTAGCANEGARVGELSLRVMVDSAHAVACYTSTYDAHTLACVRIDGATVRR